MELTWFGHSSFLITDSNGTKILTDPFDGSVGYKTYTGNADIVTISHHHYDHDYIEEIKGNADIIDNCGTFEKHSISIKGDRKSTRLNSSHANISYAVFCLK